MREIKFRAWDEELKTMVYDFKNHLHILQDSDTKQLFVGGLKQNGDWKQPQLMQYTGRKDKHGTEMYDGDIIQDCHSGEIKLVKWREDFCAFVLQCIETETDQWMTIMSDVMPHEIVGNIYQHPELLQ